MQRIIGIGMSLLIAGGAAALELDFTRGTPLDGSPVPVRDNAVWRWRIPADRNTAEWRWDLAREKINPQEFDEIQVELCSKKSLVLPRLRLTDFPAPDLARNWYAKIALTPDVRQDWRVDLQLDDDGAFRRQAGAGSTLTLSVDKRYLRTPGEPADREVEIHAVRLLRRPVSPEMNELDAKFERDDRELRWRYPITVANREITPQTVTVTLETSGLKHFRSDWTTRTLTLAPRERRPLEAVFRLPAAAAAKLPPLYGEPVGLACAGADGVKFRPLAGYRERRMWAVIPPERLPDPRRPIPPDARKKLLAEADAALAAPRAVPSHASALHSQRYLDKTTGAKLKPLSFFRHQSLKDGKIITGDDSVDRAAINQLHGEAFRRALALGQAWRLTGELKYAVAAREILLAYARAYPILPMFDAGSTGTRARLGHTTLESALRFAVLTGAYAEIVRSPALGDADRREIETQLLEPEIAALYGHNVEYTNMQVHHFQAYLTGVAALNRHWNLAGEALHGVHGYYNIIDKSFSEDGFSQEGRAYHIYTLRPLLEFAHAMRQSGVEVMTPRFKRIFDYLVLDTPDGLIRDKGWAAPLRDGYAAYADPNYLPTLRLHKWSAEPGGKLLSRSHNFASNGMLWLREKSARGFAAMSVNYRATRDRAERDRLHAALYGPEPLNGELGRVTYGSPMAKLMGETISHNAVTVDRTAQADFAARLAVFLDRPALPAALFTEDAAAPLYPKIRLSRVAALLDGLWFVGDFVAADDGQTHVFDRPLHGVYEPGANGGIGEFKLDVPTTPGGTTGYLQMTDVERFSLASPVDFAVRLPGFDNLRNNFRKPGAWVRGVAAAAPDGIGCKFRTPRGYRPQPGPGALLRVTGKQAAFAVAAERTADLSATPRIRAVTLVRQEGAGGEWRISADSGVYRIRVLRAAAGDKLEVVRE